MFTVFAIFAKSEAPLTTNDVDSPCNCEHCAEGKVIGLEKNESSEQEEEEDADQDGDRTICARNRSFHDRSFPSVCHMLCYNRCTSYRVWPIKLDGNDKFIAAAKRNRMSHFLNHKCIDELL